MNNLLNRSILGVTMLVGFATSAMASAAQEIISVPEPTVLGLLTMGVAGLVLARRLRKYNQRGNLNICYGLMPGARQIVGRKYP